MANRRNYYRLLHVQPEAPQEIIKASYRTLMTTLRLHPDRGGDTDTAALINQAYEVLSDPVKRKEYDQRVHKLGIRTTSEARKPSAQAESSPTHSHTRPAENSRTREESQPGIASNRCVFCGSIAVTRHMALTTCSRCNSPLVNPNAKTGKGKKELFGRRTTTRTAKNEIVMIYTGWPHPGIAARLRNLSPEGISFEMAMQSSPGKILKVSGNAVEGVAQVVSVRRVGELCTVHAAFLAATFQNVGSFVSTKA